MTKCLIFDLDGTLVKLPIRYELIQTELKKLYKTNSDFSPLIPTIIQRSENSKMINDAFELICKEEEIASQTFEKIDGLVQVLDHVKSKDYTVCLVTMQCKKVATTILQNLKIYDIFSSILTIDDSHDRFIQIKQTCESLNLEPKLVTMIGDRLNDIDCATRAGCNSILVNRNDGKSKNLKELTSIL